jgi:alpha-L-fucosidase
MTQSWGHTFEPQYKNTERLIHTLIDVVSKGGNFLLNVAPTPEGTFEEEAYRRLAEIGDWMEVNGEGIYETRPYQVFGEGENLRFTQTKDGDSVFVFILEWPGEELRVESLNAEEFPLGPGSELSLLGHPGAVRWDQDDDALRAEVPVSAGDSGAHAWVLKVTPGPAGEEAPL